MIILFWPICVLSLSLSLSLTLSLVNNGQSLWNYICLLITFPLFFISLLPLLSSPLICSICVAGFYSILLQTVGKAMQTMLFYNTEQHFGIESFETFWSELWAGGGWVRARIRGWESCRKLQSESWEGDSVGKTDSSETKNPTEGKKEDDDCCWFWEHKHSV